jgi:hypothetical protein
MSDQTKLAGEQALVIHQHRHEPRPLAVADDDAAQRYLGLRHKAHTYRALGVPMTPLPGGRFAVLLADVERALRARAAAAPSPATADDLDSIASAAAAGLRLVGGRR